MFPPSRVLPRSCRTYQFHNFLDELTVYISVYAVRAGARCIYRKWAHYAAVRGVVCAACIRCVCCGPAGSASVNCTSSIRSAYVCGADRFACLRCGLARSAPAGCVCHTLSLCRREPAAGKPATFPQAVSAQVRVRPAVVAQPVAQIRAPP